MVDQKIIEIVMNLYFFSLGAFGFYFLFRELFYLRKESKKKLEKEKRR